MQLYTQMYGRTAHTYMKNMFSSDLYVGVVN